MAKAFGKRTEIYLSDKCVSKLAERLYAVLKTSIRCRVQIPTKHIDIYVSPLRKSLKKQGKYTETAIFGFLNTSLVVPSKGMH